MLFLQLNRKPFQSFRSYITYNTGSLYVHNVGQQGRWQVLPRMEPNVGIIFSPSSPLFLINKHYNLLYCGSAFLPVEPYHLIHLSLFEPITLNYSITMSDAHEKQLDPAPVTSQEETPTTGENSTTDTATKAVADAGETVTDAAKEAKDAAVETADDTKDAVTSSSVFSMFGGGPKKEKKEEAADDSNEPSGSSKAKKDDEVR